MPVRVLSPAGAKFIRYRIPAGTCSLIPEEPGDKGNTDALGSHGENPGRSHATLQGLPKAAVWEDSLQSRCLQDPCQGNLYLQLSISLRQSLCRLQFSSGLVNHRQWRQVQLLRDEDPIHT